MTERKHPLAECESCPLVKEACAPTTGPEDAKVAFVSRSPGKHDIAYRRPFSGPSGQVLDYLLKQYGVKREEIITTNVVLCKTDDPPKEAIAACRKRLEYEIRNTELIIAGGTEATKLFTKYNTVFSGRPFTHHRSSVSGTKQRVIVTNNPALVIRDADSYPDIVDDFRRAFDPAPPAKFPKVEVIDDPGAACSILQRWYDTPFNEVISSDLEWRGTEYVCAGFSARPEKAVVFGYGSVRDEAVQQALKRFYERSDVSFTWHNGKADTKILWQNGIEARVDHDTFLQSYVLDERPGYHSLEYLLSTRFGWPDYEPASVKHFKKTGQFDYYGKTPQDEARAKKDLYKYNGWDSAGTLQLHHLQYSKLETDRGGSVREYYERLLHAASRVARVELNGFNYDIERAADINDCVAIPRMIELTAELQQKSDHSGLNPNSVPQMQKIYYDLWGLKHKLRDKGKKKFTRSTGKEVREQILDLNEFQCNMGMREQLIGFAATHRTYKKIQDLRSRYIEGLILKVQKDGKLYCNFNIGGTVSGRTSSNDPNFQNIAREGYEEIPGIRTLFVPSDGNVIVSADYSQAELRTCAKLSGDSSLLSIYRDSSRSLHKERAAAFYGENYTYEQYVKAKNINFGVTYGQGANTFAQMYHMPKEEAQAYITDWWNQFSTLHEWVKETQERALADGYARSPFGHKRRFQLVTNDNIGDVKREAVSSICQNVAAWLTIMALCDLVDAGIRVVATVHDSIVADVPSASVPFVTKMMKNVMERQPIQQLGWDTDDIPFLADISVGPDWGTLKELDIEKVAA